MRASGAEPPRSNQSCQSVEPYRHGLCSIHALTVTAPPAAASLDGRPFEEHRRVRRRAEFAENGDVRDMKASIWCATVAALGLLAGLGPGSAATTRGMASLDLRLRPGDVVLPPEAPAIEPAVPAPSTQSVPEVVGEVDRVRSRRRRTGKPPARGRSASWSARTGCSKSCWRIRRSRCSASASSRRSDPGSDPGRAGAESASVTAQLSWSSRGRPPVCSQAWPGPLDAGCWRPASMRRWTQESRTA